MYPVSAWWKGENFYRVSPRILAVGRDFLQSFCLEHKDFDHKSKTRKSRTQGKMICIENKRFLQGRWQSTRAAAQEQANLSGKEGRRGKGNWGLEERLIYRWKWGEFSREREKKRSREILVLQCKVVVGWWVGKNVGRKTKSWWWAVACGSGIFSGILVQLQKVRLIGHCFGNSVALATLSGKITDW